MASRAAHLLLFVAASFTALPAIAEPKSEKRHGAKSEAPKLATTPTLVATLSEAARTDYQAGKILYDDGDFATALQKFKAAYSKQADPRLLWNIAGCEKNLRHYARAAKMFRQYLVEGGDLLTPQDRKDAEDLIKIIDELTLPVTIAVNEPGAQVYLDDEPLGATPFSNALTLDIGQRRFRIEKEGFRSIQSMVQIGPTKEFSFALERMRAGLELSVPPTATVLLDGKPLGNGPRIVSNDLPVGGHALRIDAPRMRPYQGEVVLEDGKTRTLNIDLETDPEQFGEVRFAVGCSDPELRTAEQGLVVFFDGSTESASPLGLRKRVVDGVEKPAYVPYTVTAGAHGAHVRLPGCQPLDAQIVATASKPAVVEGMLPPEGEWMNGSPAGSPNGWRASVGLSTANLLFKSFQRFFENNGTIEDTRARVTLAGPSASVGLSRRHFNLLADARYATGKSEGSRLGISNLGGFGPLSQATSFDLLDLGLRAGPRLPIHSASLALGPGVSTGWFHSAPVSNGPQKAFFYLHPFAWVTLEAKPFCDFGLGGGVQYGYAGVMLRDPLGIFLRS